MFRRPPLSLDLHFVILRFVANARDLVAVLCASRGARATVNARNGALWRQVCERDYADELLFEQPPPSSADQWRLRLLQLRAIDQVWFKQRAPAHTQCSRCWNASVVCDMKASMAMSDEYGITVDSQQSTIFVSHVSPERATWTASIDLVRVSHPVREWLMSARFLVAYDYNCRAHAFELDHVRHAVTYRWSSSLELSAPAMDRDLLVFTTTSGGAHIHVTDFSNETSQPCALAAYRLAIHHTGRIAIVDHTGRLHLMAYDRASNRLQSLRNDVFLGSALETATFRQCSVTILFSADGSELAMASNSILSGRLVILDWEKQRVREDIRNDVHLVTLVRLDRRKVVYRVNSQVYNVDGQIAVIQRSTGAVTVHALRSPIQTEFNARHAVYPAASAVAKRQRVN